MSEDNKPDPAVRTPKVEGRGKPRARRQFTPIKVEFKAPTPGLESHIFQYGQTKNAAQFSKTCQALSKHVAVYFKHGGPAAALAILSLDPPIYNIPGDPVEVDNPIIVFKWKNLREERTKDTRVWLSLIHI